MEVARSARHACERGRYEPARDAFCEREPLSVPREEVVHTRGKGVCGVFTFEIAETKVVQVNEFARQNEHPLKCAMEQA